MKMRIIRVQRSVEISGLPILRANSVNRSGVAASIILIIVIAVALVGAGLIAWKSSTTSDSLFDPIVATAKTGEFVSLVLDQGEVQSSENVEIRCQARARNGSLAVIKVVTEGTIVKGGDQLVVLDATGFEKELEQQKIAMANAETSVIQSDAALQAANASLKEYEQGLFVQSKLTIENEQFDAKAAIAAADQELRQAQAVLEHSVKLLSKGFITKQQKDADEFSVKRALNNLGKANNSLKLADQKLEVLERITKEKELVRLTSDIKSAEVKFANDKESLLVEKGKLAEINQQIKNCTILVPPNVEGQVVYAKESSRGGTDWMLAEGVSVRENQVLLRLPNPKKMEVKALINEQSITQILPGMPVSIRVDALNNQSFKGIVTKVNQYAESNSMFGSSTTIRKYAVFVKILDPNEALKPGMNSSVSVQVAYQGQVLTLPIQGVYGVKDRQFCLVKTDNNQWETREIETGGDNAQVVWVKSGLKEGDVVVLNPGAHKERMVLPAAEMDSKIELPEGAKQELADAKQAAEELKAAREKGDGQVNNGSRVRGEGGRGGGEVGRSGGEGGRSGGEGGRGGGQSGGGGFDPAAMVQRMMDRYDLNKDTKIDATEMNELDDRARGMVSRADSNGDGEVTKAEIDQSMQQMTQGGGAGGGPRGGSNGGEKQ